MPHQEELCCAPFWVILLKAFPIWTLSRAKEQGVTASLDSVSTHLRGRNNEEGGKNETENCVALDREITGEARYCGVSEQRVQEQLWTASVVDVFSTNNVGWNWLSLQGLWRLSKYLLSWQELDEGYHCMCVSAVKMKLRPSYTVHGSQIAYLSTNSTNKQLRQTTSLSNSH